MKAAIYCQSGGPDVLRYEDAPDPVAAEDELLVRVEAISIEGGDTFARRKIEPRFDPHIVGYAASGEVIRVGAKVRGFAPGQKVTTFAFQGSHAALRAVPAATSWIVPDGLDMSIAAAIPCGAGTAALALDLGGVQAGQSVLVQGAAGGVGIAAVQLAHRAGARVMGTGTSAATLERLRDYGLSDAISIGATSVRDQVRGLLNGKGVDLLIDCVGGGALNDGLLALKDGGRAVLIGVVGDPGRPVNASHLIMHRLTLIGCLLGAIMAETPVHRMIASLLEEAARGDLRVPIDAEYRLSDAAAAHAHAEERGRIGRVIMVP